VPKQSKNDPIIPPTKNVSPEDALRAFMHVDGEKLKEKEEKENDQRKPDSDNA